ncbi:MAG TPA: hydroxyphenylacetyl-CoA thioesterase PaaI [Acetobacteraceae bacterium]|nr:hydroxyphenylacetyl-CoA thioesterase PaaI [Acetobacteraceae bacterium]
MTQPADPQALAEACAEAMWAEDRASRGLGMALDEVGPGCARLSMRVAEAMVNGHGICHGGFIFTLADSAMAFASNSHGERAVAQQAAISFLRPAKHGERLTAEAVERARAGRTGLYDVRVTAEDGAVVAEFRGHTRSLGEKFFGGEK